MAFKKNNPGCCNCGCAHLGPCASPIPEVLSLEETYFGFTIALIWTPTSPSDPCAGGWRGHYLLDYPGTTICAGDPCGPSTVPLRFTLQFTGGLPVLGIQTPTYPTFCPDGSGSIPDGPWTSNIPVSRISWSCGPPFAATFGLASGTSIWNCHIYPDVAFHVSVPT